VRAAQLSGHAWGTQHAACMRALCTWVQEAHLQVLGQWQGPGRRPAPTAPPAAVDAMVQGATRRQLLHDAHVWRHQARAHEPAQQQYHSVTSDQRLQHQATTVHMPEAYHVRHAAMHVPHNSPAPASSPHLGLLTS
jgi:hypothetical protein